MPPCIAPMLPLFLAHAAPITPPCLDMPSHPSTCLAMPQHASPCLIMLHPASTRLIMPCKSRIYPGPIFPTATLYPGLIVPTATPRSRPHLYHSNPRPSPIFSTATLDPGLVDLYLNRYPRFPFVPPVLLHSNTVSIIHILAQAPPCMSVSAYQCTMWYACNIGSDYW